MSACQIPGHADSYGLGIRISFYLEWFGMIITSWLLESDALNFRFLNALTILATAIGLALNLQVLQPAEICVVLLLLCGTLYCMIPIYLWKVLTCCRPWWDTERWGKMKVGWLFRTAMTLMFGTILGFQLWFWSTGVYIKTPGVDADCQQYGFLFGQLFLDSRAITALNIIIHTAMLTVGTWLFFDWIGLFEECQWWRRRKSMKWRTTHSRIQSLQQFRTVSDFLVASIIIMAIELVISWNDITGVNSLDSAAQLIPLLITAAYFLRSIHVYMSDPPPDDSHYVVFPYLPPGDGESYNVTTDRAWNPSLQPRTAYGDSWNDWAGQRRHSTRRHRRHRGSSRVHYDVGEPEMTTAYNGHYATATNVPDPGHAAENIVEPDPVHENA